MLHVKRNTVPNQFFLQTGKRFTYHSMQGGYETDCFIITVATKGNPFIQLMPLRPCYCNPTSISLALTNETIWMDQQQFCGYTVVPLTMMKYVDYPFTHSIIEDSITGAFNLPKGHKEVRIWTGSQIKNAKSNLYLDVYDLSTHAVLYIYAMNSSQCFTYDLRANSRNQFHVEDIQALTIKRSRNDKVITGSYKFTQTITC